MVSTLPSSSTANCKDFGQNCEGHHHAMLWFMMYLLFNVWYMLMYMWLLKKCGPVWFQVGNMLCLALTQVFTQFGALMGGRAQTLGYADWVGLLILLCGFWIYNLQKEQRAERLTKEEREELDRLREADVL